MSDVLVYVKETVSCSVIFDTSEVTLETFCHETLDTQDDDVLNFPYKFTRMVNNKRVVVGVKQERIFKLKQCIEESDEGESAVYLVCEDTNMQVAEQPNVQEPSPSRDDEQVPPAKKAKISQQPTLFEMFTPKPPDSCIPTLFSSQSKQDQDL